MPKVWVYNEAGQQGQNNGAYSYYRPGNDNGVLLIDYVRMPELRLPTSKRPSRNLLSLRHIRNHFDLRSVPNPRVQHCINHINTEISDNEDRGGYKHIEFQEVDVDDQACRNHRLSDARICENGFH